MKAELEVIGVKGSLDVQATEAKDFLDVITPSFVKEFGGIINDSVKEWRFKNQVRIVVGAKKLIENSGLSLHDVPLKVLEPILDRGSLEENGTLQQMWVNLLANACTGSSSSMVSFIEVLKNLDSLEVKILDLVYDDLIKTGEGMHRRLSSSNIQKNFQENIESAVSNLFRLGIVEAPTGSGISASVEGKEYGFKFATQDYFKLTIFGVQFIEVCRFGVPNKKARAWTRNPTLTILTPHTNTNL